MIEQQHDEEGEVIVEPTLGPSTETFSISHQERAVLRRVVRRVHFSKTRQQLAYSDYEIDKFIDQMGPQVMDNLLRAAQVARLPEAMKHRVYSGPGMTRGGNLRRKPRIESMVRKFLLRLPDTLPGMKD